VIPVDQYSPTNGNWLESFQEEMIFLKMNAMGHQLTQMSPSKTHILIALYLTASIIYLYFVAHL
jgi:hypothetical protein